LAEHDCEEKDECQLIGTPWARPDPELSPRSTHSCKLQIRTVSVSCLTLLNTVHTTGTGS